MLKRLSYWLFLVLFATQLSANNKEELLKEIRKIRPDIMMILQIARFQNHIFITPVFDMGHDTCDQNVIYISHDRGQSFLEREIMGAEKCQGMGVMTIDEQDGELTIVQESIFRGGQDRMRIFVSNDLGESFQVLVSPTAPLSHERMRSESFRDLGFSF